MANAELIFMPYNYVLDFKVLELIRVLRWLKIYLVYDISH